MPDVARHPRHHVARSRAAMREVERQLPASARGVAGQAWEANGEVILVDDEDAARVADSTRLNTSDPDQAG
jgi:hypothetical protein